MSAISGILFRNSSKANKNLQIKLNDSLSHRGPDGSSIWQGKHVSLGHQMLHTTTESLHEQLPFKDKYSGIVITADARIDNRKELEPILELKDCEDVTDSLFIIRAYQKWGEKCPEKLLGDFAFAIWDPSKKQLFCARDHMGVKPFYYYLSDDFFIFATEIKAFFSNHLIPKKINELKIADYLIPIYQDRNSTFYEGILRLPAAHSITVDSKKFSKPQYWELNPNLSIILKSDDDYYKQFKEIFEESIRCRLRSAFPLGFDLSGGIDSSSVVCMAKKTFSDYKNLNTFSLIFNEVKETDESYYINKIVETGKIKSHLINGGNVNPLKNIESLLLQHDEPFETPNLAMSYKFYENVQNNHIKIMISGYDGDSVLYKGESYLKELFINFRWKKLFKEITGLSQKHDTTRVKIFISRILYPILPIKLRGWLKSFRKIKVKKRQNFNYINKQFVKNLKLNKRYKEIVEKPKKKSEYNSKKRHYYYLTLGTHQNNLEVMDKMVADFSIEYRHPMLDKRLIEFCYAVPTQIKYSKGWGRMLAREGLAELLPPEIQWRTNKTNFNPVFEKNLLKFEKKRLHNILQDKIIKKYIDYDLAQDMFYKYEKGEIGSNSLDLWRITILSIWLNQNKEILIKE